MSLSQAHILITFTPVAVISQHSKGPNFFFFLVFYLVQPNLPMLVLYRYILDF